MDATCALTALWFSSRGDEGFRGDEGLSGDEGFCDDEHLPGDKALIIGESTTGEGVANFDVVGVVDLDLNVDLGLELLV